MITHDNLAFNYFFPRNITYKTIFRDIYQLIVSTVNMRNLQDNLKKHKDINMKNHKHHKQAEPHVAVVG